jgi:hypothetical protein
VLGRRIAGAKVGLGAAALVAASPFLVAADGSLMAEALFVLLITAAVLLAYARSHGCDQRQPAGSRNGFDHGGWLVPHADDDMGRFMVESISAADAFLLGRKTYEIFVA